MALSIILRRLGAASSAAKLADPPRSAFLRSRFFNANPHMADHSDDESSVDLDRRLCWFALPVPPVFLEQFSPTRSHGRNLMDGTMEDPHLRASRGVGGGILRGFDMTDTEDALYLRIDMPGLDKNDVKLIVEQTTLFIKGESAKESEDGEGKPRCITKRIELPENDFELDNIEAEMKNGVLKVRVPKVKEEERKDVKVVRVD